MPDDTIVIPVPGSGVNEMAEPTAQFSALHDQNMAGMGQSYAQFQADRVTIAKASDYDYLQAKNLVSLSQAVGVREVTSRVTPGGPSPATPV